ncbi:hypothetical protein AA313_de0209445 [Arthrobotrys entomopaga]|nr:hypothetical protein AA313_de0209445 [Arthrobotrys entomopaga]
MVQLSDLPLELINVTTSYLSFKDLQNLSLCAQWLRSAVTPSLFRQLIIKPESLLAFDKDGGLGHLAGNTRRVVISTIGMNHARDFYTYAESCMMTLERFHNIVNVEISVSIPYANANPAFRIDMNHATIITILTALCSCSFYKSLKKLKLKLNQSEGVHTRSMCEAYHNRHCQYNKLMGETRRTRPNLAETLYPPNLEQFILDTSSNFWKTGHYEHKALNPLCIIRDSVKSLRKVEIPVGSLDWPQGTPQISVEASYIAEKVFFHDKMVYPNVTELKLVPQLRNSIEQISTMQLLDRFPNIEDFTLQGRIHHSFEIGILGIVQTLGFMKNLKRVVVPWPKMGGEDVREYHMWHTLSISISYGPVFPKLKTVFFVKDGFWDKMLGFKCIVDREQEHSNLWLGGHPVPAAHVDCGWQLEDGWHDRHEYSMLDGDQRPPAPWSGT